MLTKFIFLYQNGKFVLPFYDNLWYTYKDVKLLFIKAYGRKYNETIFRFLKVHIRTRQEKRW